MAIKVGQFAANFCLLPLWLQSLGKRVNHWQMKFAGEGGLEEAINHNSLDLVRYAAFDVLKPHLLQEIAEVAEPWGKHFSELEPRSFRDAFLYIDGIFGKGKVSFPYNRVLKFEGDLYADTQWIGLIGREIDFSHPVRCVYHNGLMLVSSCQAQGFGKFLLRLSYALYEQLNIAYVFVRAGDDIGGYAWAKFGFVPDMADWVAIEAEINRRLATVESRLPSLTLEAVRRTLNSGRSSSIRVIAALPHEVPNLIGLKGQPDRISLGKYLLLGQKWSGKLDMNDRMSRNTFERYVGLL